MHIIPAFDILEGRLVQLHQGDFDQKTVYAQQPLDLAKELEAAGIKRLHITDLDGARDGKPGNLPVLEQIAAHTRLSIDYGGGLRSIPALRQVWDAGADMFSVGSVAVKAPDEFRAWVERFGPERFLVGADVRERKIAVHGWVEQTTLGIEDFLVDMFALGITQVSVTSIEREGKMTGPDLDLYRDLLKRFPTLQLVACGGVGGVPDLEDLRALGCDGVIVGTAFFKGEIPLPYFRVFSKNE